MSRRRERVVVVVVVAIVVAVVVDASSSLQLLSRAYGTFGRGCFFGARFFGKVRA